MSEENQTRPLVAPPGWTEAMQGKTSNANRVKASKRVALILSVAFFGIFLWLYVIYSLGHPKKSVANAEPVTAASSQMEQTTTPLAGQVPTPIAASPFGVPRGVETGVAQTPVNPGYGLPGATANPYAAASYAPNAATAAPNPITDAPNPSGVLPLSPAMGGPVPIVPPTRGGVTITAPRDFRHAVGIAGGSMPGMPTVPSQRMRIFVSR